ncbi:MarR family transcriptional regulator [Mycolicibacterium madagascariense]|uniref:MarR family transcriptional regulator n=1 Tax=Mycolicibacterium madagascariense TaxID=212765 RepID=A0A7I7XC22_9MYCO|nr:MarR family transcriptional regulator [Mycolicibacterium madagascariense]MCV7014763.1 MarR family transcriptional regulator [Mycolicibacterium madagascariense]BBZ26473.1 MarR family transcriptional regulator [Mycolicibacterium madagascariense]
MERVSESAVAAARDLRVMFSRLRRRLMEVATDDDLTPSQTAVLIRLVKDGPASTSQLAGAERVRPQSMAATLAGLDRHGLIVRTPDPDDGRRQLIALTPVGRKHAENDRRVREEWLVRAMQDRFTEPERRIVNEALALLERLND